MSRVILCRFGELFLKSGNRKRFEATLHRNMASAIADVPGARVKPVHGRVLVQVPDDAAAEDAAARLERVFGLVSISVATVTTPDLEGIAGPACAVATVARDTAHVTTFKIEARRSDKRLPFTSMDVAREIGGRVIEASGLRVDVHRPQLSIGIEVMTDRALVYGAERAAPGGLPVGVSGRGLVLLSGGIDSPVAAWLSAKRGLALDAVYFHSPPYIGEKSRDKVVALGKILHRWQALESITVVPFTETQKRLRDAGPAELGVVLYRRMMMRIADAVADRAGADALITGENLGQVASQTVQNLAVIDSAARHLVLRPLVTYDKVDTIALARRIGTFETSILPFDDCCSLFLPRHPATAARVKDAEAAERGLDLDAEVATAMAGAEVLRLRSS
jgi:thiamine biosynthesis protein ThiI